MPRRPQDNVERLKQQFASEVQIAVARGVKEAFDSATEKYSKEVEKKVKRITNLTHYRKYQLEANQNIADEMRQAVVDRYDAEDSEHPRNAPEYRVAGKRIGGNALRAALAGPATAIGGYDGISFINTSLLQEAAAFWRRLNFGSGKGMVGLPPISVTLFGVNFSQTPPQVRKGAPNTIPPGAWFRDGKRVPFGEVSASDEFAPLSRHGYRRKAKEISAWKFFDAGIEKFNEVAGPEYQRMVERIIEDKLKDKI